MADAERVRELYDRLIRVVTHHDAVDPLAQEFAVITAETLGDMCSITVLNWQHETMHLAGLYDCDPQALALLKDVITATADMPRDEGLAAHVIRTGEPVLMASISEAQLRAVSIPEFDRYLEQVGIESLIMVPLKGRSGNIGAISAARHRGRAPFTAADVTTLARISDRVSIAVENLILIETLRAQVEAVSSAEAALAVSEERFRSIFQSTTQGVEVMDPVGTVLETNPAFEAITGYAKSELVGRFFAGLVYSADAAALAHIFTRVKLERAAQLPVEHRILRKDGTVLWLRTSFAGIRSGPESRSVDLVVAMHENITGRVRTEQYFQAVLEATPDALIMVGPDGHILLINQQTEKLLGYSRPEVLGMPVEMLIPERFQLQHPDNRATYMHDPSVRPMGHARELFATRKDGTEIPVEVNLSYLEMEGGPIVVVAAMRDISERKKRETALVRSQRSLAEAQQVAHLGSMEYDLLTGGLDISDEGARILGLSREQATGSPSVRAIVHPDDMRGVEMHTNRVMETGEPQEFEFRILHSDGSVHVIHDRVVPFFAPTGKPTRLLATFRDVTEDRRAELDMTELKNRLQSSVELERLHLAQDLHDGPMQDLYGASYRLDELERSADTELREELYEINQQIQSTISDLRDIARELRPPSLSTFGLERAIRSYAHDFREKHPGIKLDLSLARDHQLLPEETRLTLFRVLQQALVNVLRHSHATEVQVRFSLDAEEARLSISDNGHGFAVPQNWIGFVRGGHYGLAGAAERLSALGGSLRVESRPGQSTVVTAVVPRT
jgi:PAS domain S-box-containing protein